VSLDFQKKPWFKLPDYKPKVVKRMLKEKQQSFDAAEHHKQTILKDEAVFEINDFKERLEVKSVTHLYSKRIQDLKNA